MALRAIERGARPRRTALAGDEPPIFIGVLKRLVGPGPKPGQSLPERRSPGAGAADRPRLGEQQDSTCYNLGFVAGPMAGGGALGERQRRGEDGREALGPVRE